MQGVTDYGKDPATGYYIAAFFKSNSLANYIGKAQLMKQPLGVFLLQFASRDKDISRAVKSVADSISFDERAHDPLKSRYYFLQLEAGDSACHEIQRHVYDALTVQGINSFCIAGKSFDPAAGTITPQAILDDLEALIQKQSPQ